MTPDSLCTFEYDPAYLLSGNYGEWRLSPAYDLLPSSGFNGFHTTTINNNGEPTVNDMMLVAAKVGLNKQRANEIIQKIETGLSSY